MPILPGVPSTGGFRLPLDELEAFLKERVPVHTPDVAVKESIEEDVDGALQLVGDEAAPGSSEYYGTDGTGTKGYHPLPSAGLVLIERRDITSAVASVDFTTGIDATYDEYMFVLSNVIPDTDTVNLWLRTSTDGGTNFDAGASDYAWSTAGQGGATNQANNDSLDSRIQLNGINEVGSAANEVGVSGRVFLRRPSVAQYAMVESSLVYMDDFTLPVRVTGVGVRLNATDVDAVQLLFSSGNVESGVISLYGVSIV